MPREIIERVYLFLAWQDSSISLLSATCSTWPSTWLQAVGTRTKDRRKIIILFHAREPKLELKSFAKQALIMNDIFLSRTAQKTRTVITLGAEASLLLLMGALINAMAVCCVRRVNRIYVRVI
jgi:hypothetical protein